MSNSTKSERCDVDSPGDAPAGQSTAAQTPSPSSGRGEAIAKIGTVVSAIIASSCCWLPLVLLAVGISGAGIASALEDYRPLFIVVTFGFLGAAFYFTYRPRHSAQKGGGGDCCEDTAPTPGAQAVQGDCCAPKSVGAADCCAPAGKKRRFNMMALNKAMLWAVAAMAVVFLFFPQYVTGLIGPGSGEFTADMHQTMLKVEGMTCLG
jgi:hypothetical protein